MIDIYGVSVVLFAWRRRRNHNRVDLRYDRLNSQGEPIPEMVATWHIASTEMHGDARVRLEIVEGIIDDVVTPCVYQRQIVPLQPKAKAKQKPIRRIVPSDAVHIYQLSMQDGVLTADYHRLTNGRMDEGLNGTCVLRDAGEEPKALASLGKAVESLAVALEKGDQVYQQRKLHTFTQVLTD